MSPQTRGTSLAIGALLLAALASPLQAQAGAASSRWLPFIGCWEPLGAEGDAGLLCFRPSGDGVEMSNVLEGQQTAIESMIADGTARSIDAEGCTGAESVEFSADGRRVFTASSFVCEGGETRDGTGVMSFISPTRWIDVRSLTVDGEPVAWVQRYSAATAESLRAHDVDDPAASNRAVIRSRRVAAARDIVITDVEEAAARIHPEAVKVWVATHDTEFDLSGRELVRLADSGMPEDVIDVMVAVSYPQRFAVTPDGVPEDVAMRVSDNAYRSGARVGFRSYLWDPFYAPFGYRYSRFGYYGYGGGFYGGGYYGYRPASIIVVPRDLTPGRTGGRVISGQGYRGPPAAGTGSSGNSGAARSGGSSGDSGDSSGGSSSGSSTPRRTAVPR
ncbi:MAG: hypothetical protein OEO79_17755 [Gemmatimonadota bacterium]|nr:hypothetical protein [Gemmatimonadota bacterium]MDH3422709.1 hypothetical protein [Gemmatimonadota bacterium]